MNQLGALGTKVAVAAKRVGGFYSEAQLAHAEGELIMVAVNYLWNPINDNIVREFDDAGATIAEYATEPDLYGSVVSQYRDGDTSYLHFDGQGNTTELTNDAGDVTDTIRYSTFGDVTAYTSPTDLPFKYLGQIAYYSDVEAGDYSVRQQVLSPQEGRWLSVYTFGHPNSPHAYHYEGNSLASFKNFGAADVPEGPPSPEEEELRKRLEDYNRELDRYLEQFRRWHEEYELYLRRLAERLQKSLPLSDCVQLALRPYLVLQRTYRQVGICPGEEGKRIPAQLFVKFQDRVFDTLDKLPALPLGLPCRPGCECDVYKYRTVLPVAFTLPYPYLYWWQHRRLPLFGTDFIHTLPFYRPGFSGPCLLLTRVSGILKLYIEFGKCMVGPRPKDPGPPPERPKF